MVTATVTVTHITRVEGGVWEPVRPVCAPGEYIRMLNWCYRKGYHSVHVSGTREFDVVGGWRKRTSLREWPEEEGEW